MGLEGKFVVFEGTDGVGKSTQVDRLTNRLREQDYDVMKLSTPSNLYRNDEHVARYNKTGSGLLTPTTLAVMSAADRLRTYDTQIGPHIDKGGVVLCDRYKFSAEAYFKMRGADVSLLGELHERLPDPDYAVLLTISALARQIRLKKRATTDDWEEKDMSYQDTVQDEIVAKWKPGYKIVNSEQSIDDIATEINLYLDV